MKKRLLTTLFGATLIVTGCARHDHVHDEQTQSNQAHDHHTSHAHTSESHHHNMDDHHGGHNGHGTHQGHHGMSHGESLAGRPGIESEIDRTIKVEANDAMRFIHEPIKVKTGETIKFEITNSGALVHEFSIGTKDEHAAHSKMMMDHPDMHHGPGGSSITIEPGKTETLIWYFEEAWEVQAACNIPGHYGAGMHSDIKFGE